MRSFKAGLITSSLLAPVLVAGGMFARARQAAASASHGHQALFVSKNASSTGSGQSCNTARYNTIRSALKAAPPWSAVVVCPGSYHEQVVVKKPVSLIGLHATINEKDVNPKFVVNPPGVGKLTIFAGVVIVSSHVRVQHLTVTNALWRGRPGRRGAGHHQRHHHQAQRGGAQRPGRRYPARVGLLRMRSPRGRNPGDCGEGVHLLAVADSQVNGNFIAHNSGGVLLTDETGPTHNNVIENNLVTRNASDCGITVPHHNPAALNSKGQRQQGRRRGL